MRMRPRALFPVVVLFAPTKLRLPHGFLGQMLATLNKVQNLTAQQATTVAVSELVD